MANLGIENTCPTKIKLQAYFQGRLCDLEFEATDQHLETGCLHCNQFLAEIDTHVDETEAILAKAILIVERPITIGSCNIESEIGRGGMGVVYKGTDSADRLVAIKVISPLGRDKVTIKRFETEARAWGRIRHINVVTQYHFGVDERWGPYIVMEFVEGITLDKLKRLDELQMLPGCTHHQIARYMADVAYGVHACHEKNVIHRDLKPSNIMIASDGTPKVTDFGVAKITDKSEEGLTQNDATLGTPEYMSPEQAMGRKVTVHSDVYSLGVILFELVTGDLPFRGDDRVSIRDKILNSVPPKPAKLSGRTPKDLEAIILKCLEKDPLERYESAKMLAVDLRRFLEGRPILAQPAGPAEKLRKWTGRNPWAAGLISALVFALVAFGIVLVRERKATRNAQQATLAANEATEKTEFEKYVGQIQLAENAYQNNNLKAVATYLSDTKAEFREIEWNLLNNLCRQEKFLIEPKERVIATSWNPDLNSNEFAIVSCDDVVGYIEIWNSTNWTKKSTIKIGSSNCVSIHWPSNRIAWLVEPDGELQLANFRNGKPLAKFTQKKLGNITISPDGKWLVGTNTAGGVVWNLESGSIAGEWVGEVVNYRKSVFHPHQNLFVTMANSKDIDEKLVVRELPSGRPLHILRGHEGERMPNAGCFSPDGSIFVSGTYIDPRVSQVEEIGVWNFSIPQPELLQKIPLHKNGISAISFHPDGRHILTAGLDNIARILELDDQNNVSLEKMRTFLGHGKYGTASFSDNGQFFATVEDDNRVRIWNSSSVQYPMRFSGHPKSGVFSAAVSPDNRSVATGGSGGLVNIFELGTGKILQTFCATENNEDFVVHSLMFSSDGKRLAAGGIGIRNLGALYHAETTEQIPFLSSQIDSQSNSLDQSNSNSNLASLPTALNSLAFHPRKSQLYLGGDSSYIQILDSRSGEVCEKWEVFRNEKETVRQLCFSPDGRLGVISSSGNATVFDNDREAIFVELPNESGYHCMAFSKDLAGSVVAFANYKFETIVFNSKTGKRISRLKGHEGVVTSIEFTMDGKRIITSSNDCSVRFWDVTTGKMLLKLSGHPGAVMIARLTPNERYLITAGWGNTTLVWDVSE